MGSELLSNIDGNAMSIIGVVIRAMKSHGKTQKERTEYINMAQESDYDHLLQVSIKILDEMDAEYDED